MLMASACKRFISRSSSFVKSASRTNGPKSPFSRSAAAPSSIRSPFPSQSTSPLRRFSFSRCPSELGLCAVTVTTAQCGVPELNIKELPGTFSGHISSICLKEIRWEFTVTGPSSFSNGVDGT